MVRSIIQYRINCKERDVYVTLTVRDQFYRELPEPEESYAVEETKLVRILSIYYDYRKQMEQLQEKLIADELTLTVDELKEELEKLVYYEEIIPMNPHSKKAGKKVKFYMVILCILIWGANLLLPYILVIFK
ncbi:MAG: hypothetical protein K2K96_00965 [Lachnospiraceae bacterium]|nr:hypothetical protein [Lachnospiraceae bacterium]